MTKISQSQTECCVHCGAAQYEVHKPGCRLRDATREIPGEKSNYEAKLENIPAAERTVGMVSELGAGYGGLPECNLSVDALEALSAEHSSLVVRVKDIERSLAVHCEQIAEATSRRNVLAQRADKLWQDIEWGRQPKYRADGTYIKS